MPTYLMFDKNIWKKPDLYAIHDYICFVISTHWISDDNKNLKVDVNTAAVDSGNFLEKSKK